MKTCKVCGTRHFDTAVVCEKCHAPLANKYNSNYHPPQSANYYARPEPSRNSGLRLAAKVFMIISTVSAGIGLFFSLIFWLIGLFSVSFVYSAGAGTLSIASLIFVWAFLPSFVVDLLMTINYCHKTRGGEQPGVAFKICTLLFVNLIAGILMLCDNEEKFRDR